MSPALALGQTVHEVLESLSVIKTEDRFKQSLKVKYEQAWSKISGTKGGFVSPDQEEKFKSRGQDMLSRIENNPGPIKNLAVKIKMDLPYYWLSEADNIILCGKIDWLEYFPDLDAVHIIDFKTSKYNEEAKSLQLPIYYLLATNCQNRQVIKASYWYLERDDDLTEKDLPDAKEAEASVLKIAKEIKLARKLNRFKCPNGESGCMSCRPLQQVISGKGQFVGVNEYNQDVYILDKPSDQKSNDSEIL